MSKIEMNVSPDVKRAMTSFKTAMNKKYGEGGDIFSNEEFQNFESISSGSAILDGLLGNGGWVRGRIHEAFGISGSGKSSIVSMTCANARKQYPDKYILYVDAEQACLGPDSDIYIPSKKGNEKISALVNTTFDVMSYKKDGTFFIQKGRCVETGTKELFRIKTEYGYHIDATSDHRLLVNDEYKEVKDISVGDKLTATYGISSTDRTGYSWNVTLAKVLSIESIGDSKVYDIVTESNDDFESNFVANGLVVHNCNFPYMKKLGLDCENDEGVVFIQMQEAENVFEIIDSAVATGAFSLIVVDSVPALMTKRELSGDYDKETMAEKARFLSKALPKLLESLKKANTTLIFVNQVRDKMDLFGGITTPGNIYINQLFK